MKTFTLMAYRTTGVTEVWATNAQNEEVAWGIFSKQLDCYEYESRRECMKEMPRLFDDIICEEEGCHYLPPIDLGDSANPETPRGPTVITRCAGSNGNHSVWEYGVVFDTREEAECYLHWLQMIEMAECSCGAPCYVRA